MIKRILLTGDKGYLGSVLRIFLEKEGFEVIGFDIKTSENQDIRDIKNFEDYSNVDCVIHLAGIVGDPNCNENMVFSYETNVKGTRNVVSFCKKYSIPLIFASTCSVYGKAEKDNISEADELNPLSLYALTKKLNEEDIKNELDNYLILRFGTLFGQTAENRAMRYDLVINSMTKTAIEKGKVSVFGGKQRRPFISLQELSRAITKLISLFELGKQKKTYNMVSFNKTILDLGKEISAIIGSELEIEEKITDARDYSVSNQKLLSLYNPKNDFEQGVREMAENLKNKIISRKEFLPYCLPSIGNEEINEVIDTLKSGWLSTGPKTIQFEEKIADYLGVKHAIAVNSCTAGLHLSLIVLDIGPGDEVIVSPLTFASSANMIVNVGARPVFVDIKNDTYNIDPQKIESAITPRTKAIMVVHYAGQPADMKEIKEIADKHNLKIIEDAAHAIGSEYYGEKIGSLGNLTCFSFYATKNMTTGEGGIIATDYDNLAEKLKILRLHGISKDAWKRYDAKGSWFYEIEESGWKYNMTDIQASLGIHQLEKLESFIKKRQEIAEAYKKAFQNMPIKIPYEKPGIKHIYHLYPVLVDNRDKFIEEMKKANIGTSVHFIPLHLHPFYQRTFGYKKGDFPIAEEVYQKLVSLPLYPKMSEQDVNDVISAVKRILSYK